MDNTNTADHNQMQTKGVGVKKSQKFCGCPLCMVLCGIFKMINSRVSTVKVSD